MTIPGRRHAAASSSSRSAGSLRHDDPAEFHLVYPLVVGLFVLFSTMTLLDKVMRKSPFSLLDMLALFANAGAFFAVSHRMVGLAYGHPEVALVSVGLAAFYAGHVVWFLRRRGTDRGLLVSCLGLAAAFVALTMPLVCAGQWVTVTWAIQAAVLVWIAERLESRVVRLLSFGLFALVLVRWVVLDIGITFRPDGTLVGMSAGVAVADYLWLLAERAVTFGATIAACGVAARLLGGAPPRGADAAAGPSAALARRLLTVACVGMSLLYLTLETGSFLAAYGPGFRAGGVSILWALFALGLVAAGLVRDVGPARWAGLGLFALVSAKVFLHDLASLDTFWRIVAFIVLGLVLIAGSFVYLTYRDRAGAVARSASPGLGG